MGMIIRKSGLSIESYLWKYAPIAILRIEKIRISIMFDSFRTNIDGLLILEKGGVTTAHLHSPIKEDFLSLIKENTHKCVEPEWGDEFGANNIDANLFYPKEDIS